MPDTPNMDLLLQDWEFQPGEVTTRLVQISENREVIQMRIDLGVMQMETDRRPDGKRPEGDETYFDFLVGLAIRDGDQFTLNKQQCVEADREFIQFYHRRVCWLSLREYRKAARDADHTLAFMDFVRQHSPDDEWKVSHEQYRPFVLFHRVQAMALASLEDSCAGQAVEEINHGLERFRELFASYGAEEQFSQDELVRRLEAMRENVRHRYNVGPTLEEQLAAAVLAENYELAAELRDRLLQLATKPQESPESFGDSSNHV